MHAAPHCPTSATYNAYPSPSSVGQLLRGITVKRASSGEEIGLLDAWDPATPKKTIVAFFTHTADFNSW